MPFFHQVFNRGFFLVPYYCLCALETIGLTQKGLCADAKQLLPYLDVVKLYEPYLKNNYFFESSMHIPPSFEKVFYGENLAIATHKFMISAVDRNEAKKRKKSVEKRSQRASQKSYELVSNKTAFTK